MKKSLLILSLFISLSSCRTLRTHSETVETTEVYGEGVKRLPVLADLKISNKRESATAEGLVENISNLKKMAVSKLLVAQNADVLIDPRYIIDTKNKAATVTASGFPATYKNFRQFKKEDLEIFKSDSTKNK